MPEGNTKTILNKGQQLAGQVRSRLTGKSRQVVAIAALAGVTGVGLAAASFAHPNPTSPAHSSAAALTAEARDAAAARADRSQRQAASTQASADAKTAADAAAAKKAADAAAAKKAADAKKAAAAKATGWTIPIPGAQVTSCYGQRWGVLHAGIDFAAAENTPEHAASAGTVVAAGWVYSGYGISVLVDHGNGLFTHYAHMNKTVVHAGQKVAAGQILGYEGSTGDSTGPHLHFEVWKGMWGQIDPAPFLAAKGIKTTCS
ncbi:M23 family metallopeptidase [Hamadaea tsunoensis]|uniref:M23 family metallopeptidase n=1 Tax=Hamadaea tsunoensis TaxID=53368 RepID=UPI00041D35D9|nr:M23 family metallopeptidase [Hamadaea tsunoensis]